MNNFALLKMINEVNVDSSVQGHVVEVTLMPQGTFSMDIGVYSN